MSPIFAYFYCYFLSWGFMNKTTQKNNTKKSHLHAINWIQVSNIELSTGGFTFKESHYKNTKNLTQQAGILSKLLKFHVTLSHWTEDMYSAIDANVTQQKAADFRNNPSELARRVLDTRSSCKLLKPWTALAKEICPSVASAVWFIKSQSLSLSLFWTFSLLLPPHLAILWSSLHCTKCRRFIPQQNSFSVAWQLLIFVLALLFIRFLPLFWRSAPVETGIFFP